MKVYETEVLEIGENAESFKEEQMLILFGKDAPGDLTEYSYSIQINPVEGDIHKKMTLSFDDEPFEITAVGNVVEKNLNDLGHITLRFDGSEEAELPGTLYLENKELPTIEVGTKITID